MTVLKYLGEDGLKRLIEHVKNNLSKKGDKFQFVDMPDVKDYIGKVVQYIGPDLPQYTNGHFYHSDGRDWHHVNLAITPISKDLNNAIEQRPDGVYVKDLSNEFVKLIKVSTEANNAIAMRNDGLYAVNSVDIKEGDVENIYGGGI